MSLEETVDYLAEELNLERSEHVREGVSQSQSFVTAQNSSLEVRSTSPSASSVLNSRFVGR